MENNLCDDILGIIGYILAFFVEKYGEPQTLARLRLIGKKTRKLLCNISEPVIFDHEILESNLIFEIPFCYTEFMNILIK